jgi:hypothetical protein
MGHWRPGKGRIDRCWAVQEMVGVGHRDLCHCHNHHDFCHWVRIYQFVLVIVIDEDGAVYLLLNDDKHFSDGNFDERA